MSTRVDRLLRWVWLANGVLLLGLVAFALVFVIGQWITEMAADDEAVAVSPDRRASTAGERPRAVRYNAPEEIRGTDTRILMIHHGQAYRAPSYGVSERAGDAEGPIVNVAFVGPDGGGRLLLDRPAYVYGAEWPGGSAGIVPMLRDSLLRWVVYEMALEDANRDGKLNHRDPRTLYLSRLDGTGLRPVLPAGFTLHGWSPRGDGSLFVSATPAPAGGREVPEEQRPLHAFVVGADGQARPYAALDSLASAAGRILQK